VTELEQRWLTESPPVDRQKRVMAAPPIACVGVGTKSSQRSLTPDKQWPEKAKSASDHKSVSVSERLICSRLSAESRAKPRCFATRNPTKMWVDTVNGADQGVNFG
jgi:hypothetical protein